MFVIVLMSLLVFRVDINYDVKIVFGLSLVQVLDSPLVLVLVSIEIKSSACVGIRISNNEYYYTK